MSIYESRQWMADIDEILAYFPEFEELAGKSVMVTGAAGLICSSVVDILMRYNDTHKDKVVVYAAGRQPEKIISRFSNRVEQEEFRYVAYDALKTDNRLDFDCDYIIHGAGNSFPGAIVAEPVETMLSHFAGIKCLLDYAKEHGTTKTLYISSSEVYGQNEGNQPYCEGEYGYIDLLNARNSYSMAKRAAETLCASYFDEYGVESVIVRPGHVYGPTASPDDNRVSSSWAYAAARGEDIVMKSDGGQLRSYCYCLDCASAILKVLLRGENVHAYNISNPDSVVTIRQMAELLAKAAQVQLRMELPTEEERKGFNLMRNSSLDSASLRSLGWKGLFNAEKGFLHTVDILKEILSAENASVKGSRL
nr:NAD(P)-dependent oxidoreductase [uncultured Acetatifactor sp.]